MALERHAYLIGGGIGSLAAAAFMIRDGAIPGTRITIYEALPLLGGSLDAAGNPQDGYSFRGGRMLTTDNFECTWDLFRTIPSQTDPELSVFEETVAFNERVPGRSQARLVDRHRAIVDVTSMGFSMKDRLELLELTTASEQKLGTSVITDWFSPPFFETNFWFMWQTTFAFQPWHSAVEFKRYLHRFMKEFSRIETLAGVKRTVYNQYDSLVRPLVSWLTREGVRFQNDTRVTQIELAHEGEKVRVVALHCQRGGGGAGATSARESGGAGAPGAPGAGAEETIRVGERDLVFFQNGSMTDASSLGSMTRAPAPRTKADSGGWELWEKLAAQHPEFGNPAAFNSSIPESCWESFTVTLRDSRFFDRMQAFTGNEAGTGGLVTFKDSSWLMSIVLAHQPHFEDQPADVQVFWGYALHPDRVGDHVPKPMAECTGEEILIELCGHLKFDPSESFASATCIPCRMPYITSMFMPRRHSDRPLPVPKNSLNLAFVSQFVEIPEDVVFTVEYSVRAAQTAVYELLGVQREVPPVKRHDKSLQVNLDAVIKAFQ